MSCPFYAHGIVVTPDGSILHPQERSNRCALIIDAHSPCYMEAFEKLPPDYNNCPRNPLFNVLPAGKASWPEVAQHEQRRLSHDLVVGDLKKFRLLRPR